MKRRPLTPGEQNRMMAALQRARMACNAAVLVDPELVEERREQVDSSAPKLDELETLLDELCRIAGLKAVVFSQWAIMTELVEQRVRRMGLGSVRLHGGVPTANRGKLMDRFRDDDAVQVFISTDAGGVGLNLQNAVVLIDLDIPWNPAILDQRIARVHRLGQKQKVQAILLVAPESYEERVLELVQGKRQLFDNVVHEDATEDVVGVSKRLAEVLAEDLAALGPSDDHGGPTVGSPVGETELSPDQEPDRDQAEAPSSQAPIASAMPLRPGLDEAVRDCVIGLQQHFGPRITRILAQRSREVGLAIGRGGLLVVLDQVNDKDDAIADGLSERVPVALIDRRTLASLSRLGDASPVAEAESVYAVDGTDAAAESEPLLLRKAREGLEAARLLIQQRCPGPALDLMLSALLASAALRAGQADPPNPSRAGIWLYGEVLPAGLLQQQDAALLMRAIALGQGADAVPDSMLTALADDAAVFIAATSST
jgi:hypothetical protein